MRNEHFDENMANLSTLPEWLDYEELLRELMEKCKEELMLPLGYGFAPGQIHRDLMESRKEELRGEYFLYQLLFKFMNFVLRRWYRKKRREAFIRGMAQGIRRIQQDIKIAVKRYTDALEEKGKEKIKSVRNLFIRGRDQIV